MFPVFGEKLDDVLSFEAIEIPSVALVTREGVQQKITF